jgi:hypothetical protein
MTRTPMLPAANAPRRNATIVSVTALTFTVASGGRPSLQTHRW